MQAVKDKLHDITTTYKAKSEAKAEAKAEEKAEKEIAKARMDVAHEVRLAKEAEAEMEMHVAKAGERAEKEVSKHSSRLDDQNNDNEDYSSQLPLYNTSTPKNHLL